MLVLYFEYTQEQSKSLFSLQKKRSKFSHEGRSMFQAFKDCQMHAGLLFCHSLLTITIPAFFQQLTSII